MRPDRDFVPTLLMQHLRVGYNRTRNLIVLWRSSPPPSGPPAMQLQGLNLWSTGPILEAVQSNRFFADSKHFV